jgi:hypothetical protein
MQPTTVIRSPFGVSTFIFEPKTNYSQPAVINEMGSESIVVQGMTPLPNGTRVIVELHLFIPLPDELSKRGIPRIHCEVASTEQATQAMKLRISKGGLFDAAYWGQLLDAIAKNASMMKKF